MIRFPAEFFFPIYQILICGDKGQKQLVYNVKENMQAGDDDCRAVALAFKQVGGVKSVMKLAKQYAHKAKLALDFFEKSEARDFLSCALANFVGPWNNPWDDPYAIGKNN